MPAKNLRRVAEGGTYCHVYNKGIENKIIFADDDDYQVFLGYLEDYLSEPKTHESKKAEFTVKGRVYRGVPHQPKNYFGKVELLAYNLEPNHFHLLLHQKTDKSLQAFIRSLCTRYSMYFNKKYNRTGTLFDGPYKSANISSKDSLLLLTQYLHKPGGYSSYAEYTLEKETPWVETNVVLSVTHNQGSYKDYINNYKPTNAEENLIKNISIDNHTEQLERRDLKVEALKPTSRIPEIIVASTVFVLLIGLSLKNIALSTKSNQIIPTTLGITNTVSPTPEAITTSTIEDVTATKSASTNNERSPSPDKTEETYR